MIRKATENDLNGIIEIEKLSFREEGFHSRQFKYLLSKSLFFVAVSENKVLGYIILLQSVRIAKIRLYSIAVHPEARKNHIGQDLLDYTFQIVKTLNKNGMYLEVRESNQSAIRFYEKNGFCIKGKKTSYYPDGENALVMHWLSD